jgi:hypothetical protein
MQGRLMGAGSTCFHNLKGAWLKLHFFNNACKDFGVQGIRLQFGGGRGAVVAREGCCGRVLCRAKRVKAEPNMVQKVQNAP